MCIRDRTKVTQPAVFLHSVISALCMGDDFKPEMTAGHSLGEFSALVAAGALSVSYTHLDVYKRQARNHPVHHRL